MTCIAGYTDGQTIMLMADGAASGSNGVISTGVNKLIRLGAALIGVSGGLRQAQLIRHRAPALRPVLSVSGPMPVESTLLDWLDAVRAIMREAGTLQVKDGVEMFFESRMLIALDGRFFEIDSEWQVIETMLPYWAIGSGQQFALGAIHAQVSEYSRPQQADPEATLLRALEAAAALGEGVRAPFHFVSMDVKATGREQLEGFNVVAT